MKIDKINKVQIFDGSALVFESDCENIEYVVKDDVLNMYIGNEEDEISITKRIEHDNNRITITSLLNESGESASVWVDYRKNIDDDFTSWDNDEWILGELKSLVNDKIDIEDCEHIDKDDILSTDYYYIKGILNKAIELGFFNYMKK